MTPVLFIVLLVLAALLLTAFANPSLPQIRDAQVACKAALPMSTTATTSTSIAMNTVGNVGIRENVEFLLTAPALSTAELPDSKTMTYAIVGSANANLSGATVLLAQAIVQTGAGGVGAAGATKRFRAASDWTYAYLGFTCTPSASGAGDASAETATMEGVF